MSSTLLPGDMDACSVLGDDDDVAGLDVPKRGGEVNGWSRPGQIGGVRQVQIRPGRAGACPQAYGVSSIWDRIVNHTPDVCLGYAPVTG